jgi:signal transduction histidine kinase
MAATVEALLTPAARRYIESMLGAVASSAGLLDRRFRATLRRPGAAGAPAPSREYQRACIKALLAITPGAASRLRSLAGFFEQVDYNGRRLAKLNLPPDQAYAALDGFGALLGAVLGDNFQPAREQLHLATVLALSHAFYEVREAETQAFFGLYRAEAEAPSLPDMLRQFVRILTRAVHARTGRLIQVDGAGAKKLARPRYIESGGPHEPLVSRELLRRRYASYWSYPVGGAAVLQFAFATPYPWLPRELTLLGAAAKRCREAMERARLEGEVRQLHVEALRAEQDERRRIGRELHDEAGQSRLFLRLELEMLEREAPEALAARLRAARQVAERTIAELRRVVAALSPAVLERLGLKAALHHLAERFLKMHGCELRVRISGPCERLSRQQEEAVYRVAQESLQNCAKHSQATRVNLSLRLADKGIRLRVADNGAGFCADTAKNKPMAFGLAGMRERAALMGGTLAIHSAPGKGAAVVLDLPQVSARVIDHVKNSRTAH